MTVACDAIILAGGELNSELRKIAAQDTEGLILIGSFPMIHYVYTAVRATPGIDRIVICGPQDALAAILPRDERLFFTAGGDTAIESFRNAVDFLRTQESNSRLLVLPVDIPLITMEAIHDFMERCSELEGDFFYSIVSREISQEQYPEQVRTYVHLKEGDFTGGNLIMVKRDSWEQVADWAEELVRRRKNPVAMARLFGLRLTMLLLLRRLSISATEQRVSKVLGLRGRAVITPYAEIGIDVDKISDLNVVKNYLAKNSYLEV